MNKKKKFNDYCQNFYCQYLDENQKDFRRPLNWFAGWLKFIEKRLNLKKYQNVQ